MAVLTAAHITEAQLRGACRASLQTLNAGLAIDAMPPNLLYWAHDSGMRDQDLIDDLLRSSGAPTICIAAIPLGLFSSYGDGGGGYGGYGGYDGGGYGYGGGYGDDDGGDGGDGGYGGGYGDDGDGDGGDGYGYGDGYGGGYGYGGGFSCLPQ